MQLQTEDRVLFTHAEAPLCTCNEGPLRGLRHRTVIDEAAGSSQLALWQEEHLPGFVVPPHRHDCEEIITVTHGEIEAQIEEAIVLVRPGESILIPPQALHGFAVTSESAVKLLAIFGSARPLILKADGTSSTPPWEGGRSDHLMEEQQAALE